MKNNGRDVSTQCFLIHFSPLLSNVFFWVTVGSFNWSVTQFPWGNFFTYCIVPLKFKLILKELSLSLSPLGVSVSIYEDVYYEEAFFV